MSDEPVPDILILGARGQVGKELCRALNDCGNTVELDSQSVHRCGDLRDQGGLSRTIQELRPSIIINAAAYTKVDLAESNQAEAFATNFNGVKTLAHEAQKIGALLIHFSTDYVFDGSLQRPYTEVDITNPLNVYGDSKLKGDLAVMNSGCEYLIFRTSWVYSPHGDNFLKKILHLGRSKSSLSVVCDQIGVPTSASLIARVVTHCLQSSVLGDGFSGVYNLTPRGASNWHEYAVYALAEARNLGWPIKTTEALVEPVSTEYYKGLARRPLYSCLNTHKLRTSFDIELPDWKHDVKSTVARILEDNRAR